MARQNARTAAAKSTDETATPETTEEVTVTENATETPTEGTESTETPAAETEAPIDLTAFKEAAAKVIETADKETGEVVADNVGPANEAYRLLEGQKAKAAARAWLQEAMLEAVGKLDAVGARSYSDIAANLKAGSSGPKASTPADPTAAYVAKVSALTLALALVQAEKPEGDEVDAKVTEAYNAGWELAQAHLAHEANEAEDKGDGPDLTPVVRQALKLAAGKATGGGNRAPSTGPRGDIAKHIQAAFAEQASGTFLKVSEIAKFKSAEYPEGNASQGAISVRLFPKTGSCTVEGVIPVDKGTDGATAKGAKKA